MSVERQNKEKFDHLEIKLVRFSFLSIKLWKFGTLKDTMIGFKLEAKKNPRDTKNWNFEPLKDTTNIHTILPYKNPLGGGACSFRKFVTMILYVLNAVVPWLGKLKFTHKLLLPLESPPIKFETQIMLSNSDTINVWNFWARKESR